MVLPSGRWNEVLIHNTPTVALPTEAVAPRALRYFQALTEHAAGGADDVWFIGRSGHDAYSGYSTLIVHRNPTVPAVTFINDRAMSHNLCAQRDLVSGLIHLYGGQYWPGYAEFDGIRHIIKEGFADLHDRLIDDRGSVVLSGRMEGCVTARHNGWCEFDGKLSAVIRPSGETLLYFRQNHLIHGGRFVGMARSHHPSGPFGYIEQISIQGWNPSGDGNLYFAAVETNPVDNHSLLGLFPVNEGHHGETNGDGSSYIGLAISCNGLHWSALTPLVWSQGKDGRTKDHPVDGMVTSSDGDIAFWVHHDVPYIASDWETSTHVDEYRIDRSALIAWSRSNTLGLHACTGGALHDRGVPSPPALPPSAPPLALKNGADPSLHGCDEVLHEYCRISCNPVLGAHTIARHDRGSGVLGVFHRFRCYSFSTLTTDLMHYRSGSEYCTRDEAMLSLLHSCQRQPHPPPPPPPPPPSPPHPSPPPNRPNPSSPRSPPPSSPRREPLPALALSGLDSLISDPGTFQAVIGSTLTLAFALLVLLLRRYYRVAKRGHRRTATREISVELEELD